MSQITEQADELRKKAIEILLNERAAIDERLNLLAYQGTGMNTPTKQRTCRTCGSPEHDARRCPTKHPADSATANSISAV